MRVGKQPAAQPLPRTPELFWPLAQVAGIWIAADIGYFFLLPALGVQPNYNSDFLAVTLYYAFWAGFAVITFWPLYLTWPRYTTWTTFDSRLASYLVWTVSFGGCIFFAAYVLPYLPPVHWKESWTPPPDFVLASPYYFVPKSLEIFFQQLLIVALVLALSAQGCSLRKITICSALAFGGTHVLLAFGGVPVAYVIRFMLSAATFGLIFPYLILRVRNGFAFSYVIHWIYYAVSVVLPHIFLSEVR